MKLLTLKINNFKAIRDLTITPNGRNMTAYGQNGTNKTTLFDAVSWLLFGKDSEGRKDYKIKTNTPDGKPIHFLDHSVEGVFEMANGKSVRLTRTYREKWVMQRGSATDSFDGHKTSFEVNGVPRSEGEYQDYIASICEERAFMRLTNPRSFFALEWKGRRAMIFDICGDMTDTDVIAADPELADLTALMGDYSVEDFKKVVTSQRTKVNDERKTVPARIDEANRALPPEDKTLWRSILATRQADLTKLMNERSSLTAGGKASELRAKITGISTQCIEIENELRGQPDPAREAAIKAKREKTQEVSTGQQRVDLLEQNILATERNLTSASRTLQAKRDEVEAEYAKLATEREKVYSGESECPACNRPLEAAKVKAAVEAFNSAKAKRIAAIEAGIATMQESGKQFRAEHDAIEAKLTTLRDELSGAIESLTTLQAEHDAIEIPAETVADPTRNPAYVKLVAERDKVAKEIENLTTDSAEALSALNEKIATSQSLVEEANSGLANIKQRADGLARVQELESREKDLAAQFEVLERNLHLCELFVKSKVRLLTEQINSMFKLTTFQLFNEQINGGISECCDVLWRETGALPSNGQEVQIGLDIISALSEHLEFSPFILIDNAESVTDFPITQGQQIRLKAAEGEPIMKIVYGDQPIDLDHHMGTNDYLTGEQLPLQATKQPALF